MLSYIKTVLASYKTWKLWKGSGMHLYRGFIPSETYVKYPPDSQFGGKKVLNFGCGRSVYNAPNVINTDVVAHDGVIVRDPSRSLAQFGRDFDLIIANHVMEHVPNWFETFKEMATIVKPGGMIEIWIPPVSSDSAFTYRDHINRIGLESFAGTLSNRRSGTNLLAGEEFKELGDVAKLRMVHKMMRPCLKWWIFFAPLWLLDIFATHLRNTISEEGFFFTKEA
jgi:predicted SAM-dependent methyltransferase